MGGFFKFNSLKDKRQKFKKYKVENYFYGKTLERLLKLIHPAKEVELWIGDIPMDPFIYISGRSQDKDNNNYLINFFSSTYEPKNVFTFNFNYKYYYHFILLLKLQFDDIIFPIDMCFYKKNEDKAIIINLSSYLTYSYYKLAFFFDNKLISDEDIDVRFMSISSIYPSFTWVERELAELNDITFKNLRDGRRLLTDYTTANYDTNDYKTTSYNLTVENLYIKMLHWLYIFSFLLSCSLLSLVFYYKNLLSLLLISEVIILLLFFLTIIITSFYNISFLLSFSFFLLIFGGLELALNLLLLMM